MSKPVRRTQQQRREATIGKLLDATIDALLTVGYGGTTVKAICERAGVSHGGLFRHFPSVIALVLAASEEVGRRQIAEFEARFAAMGDVADPIVAALGLLRDACRSPANTVFYELLVAARTDPQLAAALGPSTQAYYSAILDAAKSVPGVAQIPEAMLEPLLFGVVHMFDGESLTRTVLERPDAEAKRLELLGSALHLLIGGVSEAT